MPYKDVRAENITDLVAKVKAEIAKGFWPMEGGFIQEDDGNTPEKWVQMMVQVSAIPPQAVIIANTAERKIPVETTAAEVRIADGGTEEGGTENNSPKTKKVTKVKKKTSAKRKAK